MNWIVSRLEEPSTWAGIAGFVGSLSIIPNAATYAAVIVPIGTAVASVLAIVFPEKKA